MFTKSIFFYFLLQKHFEKSVIEEVVHHLCLLHPLLYVKYTFSITADMLWMREQSKPK